MIITMRETPEIALGINALKHQYSLNSEVYSDVDFKNMQGHDLYIVDLKPDGSFFIKNPAVQLAEFLTEKDVEKKINNIYLLVSNVHPNHHIVAYVQKLVDTFAKNNRDITVHFPVDLDYDKTIVFPPETLEGKWQIFGCSDEDVQQLLKANNHTKSFNPSLSLDQYKKLSSKTLIWEGNDIKNWLSDPDRKMNKKSVTLHSTS